MFPIWNAVTPGRIPAKAIFGHLWRRNCSLAEITGPLAAPSNRLRSVFGREIVVGTRVAGRTQEFGGGSV
jgi:hypothetical protein